MITKKIAQDAGVNRAQSNKPTNYATKPLTGAQARELIAQCKAYVQSKKQS